MPYDHGVPTTRTPCPSAPRPPAHAPLSRAWRTAGRTVGPANGSSPPRDDSTYGNRVANSTPCWSRAHGRLSPSSSSPLTPRDDSRPSPPDASDPPSSSRGPGNRPGADGSSSNSATDAASSAMSRGPSPSPSPIAPSTRAATGPPTRGGPTP